MAKPAKPAVPPVVLPPKADANKRHEIATSAIFELSALNLMMIETEFDDPEDYRLAMRGVLIRSNALVGALMDIQGWHGQTAPVGRMEVSDLESIVYGERV